MSVEQIVSRWRLELGWILLLSGWMSLQFSQILSLVFVAVCIIMLIAALLARTTSPMAGFRSRPFGEKALIVAAAASLIAASVAYYYLGWIKDLGGVILPINVVFLLVSPTHPKNSESQT